MKNQQFEAIADKVGLGTQFDGIILTKPVVAAEALERFAEEIVRECAEWMADGNIADGFFEADRMLKHFGLE